MIEKSPPRKKKEKFKLIKFLGAGSFAQTYKAEVLPRSLRGRWGDVVAIKIPLSKEKEETLIHELITSAALHHLLQDMKDEHIVQYLDVATYDAKYVMVMEFVDEGSLRDIIGPVGEQEALSIEETLNITIQVCKGLMAAHKARVFHRDIKPENILINSDEVVKITDFGISRMIASSELASTTAGTIYYMSKEVLDGEGSFYSDVYSLGVTMYEMLTGLVPFYNENIGKVVDKIRGEDPTPPMDINPEVDARLNDIVLTAMNRDIEKRYKTVSELLEAIENCMIEEPIRNILNDDNLNHVQKIDSLHSLSATYPGNPRIYLNIGELYNRNRRYQKAIEAFEEGIKLNPEFGLLYRDLALSLYKTGRFDEAIDTLEKTIGLGTDKNIGKHAMNLLKLWKDKKR